MNCIKDFKIKKIVRSALKEDIGRGDITTKYVIPKTSRTNAVIIAKQNGIICGLDILKLVFKSVDSRIQFSSGLKDGARVLRGKAVAKISGPAQSILSAERVALNFLSLLSGIATRTRIFVKKAKPFKTKILDTRKTVPGLRALEKYAVRVGGGFNHRFGLGDQVLIKENHIDAAGISCIKEGLKAIRRNRGRKIKIEIEVRNLKEFKEALLLKPDIIMLDNMDIADIGKAVKLRNRLRLNTRLEASGNINLRTVAAFASTGIDFISLGTLTKDIEALDFSLEIK